MIKVKKGDKVKFYNARDKSIIDVVYVVTGVTDQSVEVKHPSVAGHFTFSLKSVAEVISESR